MDILSNPIDLSTEELLEELKRYEDTTTHPELDPHYNNLVAEFMIRGELTTTDSPSCSTCSSPLTSDEAHHFDTCTTCFQWSYDSYRIALSA